MEIKKRVYLKAIQELLETAQYSFLSSLVNLDEHIDGAVTPTIKLTLDISQCPIEAPYKPNACCWVTVKSSWGEDKVLISDVKHITIENPENLKDYEKKLKNKKSSV